MTFRCANAACIIAAADSLPEPFVIRSAIDGPTYFHKQFSNKHFSDHIAVLGIFQAWQRARLVRVMRIGLARNYASFNIYA